MTISSPRGDFRLSVSDFLLALNWWKYQGSLSGAPGPQPAAGIAGPRVLDLDDLGAEPGQRLGAGRPRLELREIDDLDAFETIELDARFSHGFPPDATAIAPDASDRPRRRDCYCGAVAASVSNPPRW